MRTSRLVVAALAGAVLAFASLGGGTADAGTERFTSPREALKQGLSAYRGGYYEIAVPALEHAAKADEFLARFFLARIYADNSGSRTNHVRAYELFQGIVDEFAEVDPDVDPRAPYVGQALTALAGYVRRGLPEAGLAADLDRAIDYLHNASVIFNDEDAQFELAKLQLKGEGVPANPRLALHWLLKLSHVRHEDLSQIDEGHPGAQAFLSELLWRGSDGVEQDQALALALISVALKNAPAHERLWIEDIYQKLYCGAPEGVRAEAGGRVAGWGSTYGRRPEASDRVEFGELAVGPERTCKNGEPVIMIEGFRGAPKSASDPVTASAPPTDPARPFVYGGTSGAGLRDVGATMGSEPPRGDR